MKRQYGSDAETLTIYLIDDTNEGSSTHLELRSSSSGRYLVVTWLGPFLKKSTSVEVFFYVRTGKRLQ